VFVLLDLYLTRSIHLSEIWMLRKQIFTKEDNV